MTGRELHAWLDEHDALDLPLVLHGTVALGDDEDSAQAPLEASALALRDDEVTVWCP